MPYAVARVIKGDVRSLALHFANWRFPCFVPIETSWLRNRHARNGAPFRVERPMFPGYAFFGLHPDDYENFFLPDDPRYLLSLLMVGDKVPVVSDGEAARIKAIEDKLRDPPIETPKKKVEVGTEVVLLRGLLAKASVTVLSLRNNKLALVQSKGRDKKEFWVNLSDIG